MTDSTPACDHTDHRVNDRGERQGQIARTAWESCATAATGVYATDPDAFTEAWYCRRAVAWADDARKIVALVVEYEECHPDDAPCLESLSRAFPDIAWRGHAAT